MSLNINKKELELKNKIVDNAIIQLKKEFVGIDEQIDTVMNSVRVWYLYPQLQTNPCVINIFGMTGCGKTSLVRRIATLLDEESSLVYFNFCAISEKTSWEIEDDIQDNLGNENSKRIFVYDEFQYAATLNTDGAEKDNKNALKPFWELLDTGIIYKRNTHWDMNLLTRAIRYMQIINNVCKMNIVNGIWVNSYECLSNFSELDKEYFSDVFNFENCKAKSGKKDTSVIRLKKESAKSDNFFIKDGIISEINTLYNRIYNKDWALLETYRRLMSMDSSEVLNFMQSLYLKSKKAYKLKFNDSLIFVIANIDEAYTMAFDVNPDMSPDQFHEITKKISIVDIKKALQKRFRNEQIARLGNIHVIYPSFSSEAFRRIIDLNLDSYKNKVRNTYGIDIIFDKSIKEIIFKESVYPTQGTRPIFSTIYEMVKTKFPFVIRNIYDGNNEDKVSCIEYSYDNKKCYVDAIDSNGGIIDTYIFEDNLRLENLRETTNDECHANTAVHESGHFVIYSYLNGSVPEKLVSKSADSDSDGFMEHDVTDDDKRVWSYEAYMNDIMISLGGYVAEGIIFGERKRSSGCSEDLKNATKLASKMIRRLGFGDKPYITSYICDENGFLIKDDKQEDINRQIKCVIDKCLKKATEIINMPHIMNMLKKSSKYLFKKSQMSKCVMEELLNEARKNGKICDNKSTYYSDIVNSF